MNAGPRFDSLAAFLQMDGHGLFIWAAYGITLIVLAVNLWWPWVVTRRIVAAEKIQLEAESQAEGQS